MPKGVLRVLTIIGLLFLLLGAFAQDVPSTITALVILAVVGYFALRPDGILRKEEVIDNWSALIEGGQGQATAVYSETRRLLSETRAPDLAVNTMSLSAAYLAAHARTSSFATWGI